MECNHISYSKSNESDSYSNIFQAIEFLNNEKLEIFHSGKEVAKSTVLFMFISKFSLPLMLDILPS